MTQMVEIAQTGYDLCIGKIFAFNNNGWATKIEDKEKEHYGKSKFKGKEKYQRPVTYISSKERKELVAGKQYFFCKDRSYFYGLS